jgi:cell division protein ZapA
MSEEMIPVNIAIGDRTYRIKTSKDDEEIVRKTVKLINDKIIEFKTQFSGKDMQDYIAMVIIWYATQNANLENSTTMIDEWAKQLEKMGAQIDKSL